uniref:Uncharacterized protein n=1 Tax=Arundo donax TaxID=35708 RepID=A0A0A9C822_ARUDO
MIGPVASGHGQATSLAGEIGITVYQLPNRQSGRP